MTGIEICHYTKFPSDKDEKELEPIITKLPNCKAIKPTLDGFTDFLDKNRQIIMGIKKNLIVYYKVYEVEEDKKK